MDFDRLCDERREVRDFLNLHEASLLEFVGGDPKSADGGFDYSACSFFLLQLGESIRDEKVRPPHLSTGASCLESLAEARIGFDGLLGDRLGLAQNFARRALDADPTEWQSEEAAFVYCRARTLPAVIRFHPQPKRRENRKALNRLLVEMFSVVDVADPAMGGVMEWPLYSKKGGGEWEYSPPDFSDPGIRAETYPPNAFQTYWALRCVEQYQSTYAGNPSGDRALGAKIKTTLAWARAALGAQAALISNGARNIDPQQLAYAIALGLRYGEPLRAGTQQHELVKAGLDAFFAQSKDGVWPQSRPLFHYPAAGNAYCYTFETLAELLRPALPRETGRVYRDLLRAHAGELVKAWHFARTTRILLESRRGGPVDTAGDGRAPHYGWASTHQEFRRDPEAWATASVYSYLQTLRRALGHWASEEAEQRVGARVSKYANVQEGREVLRDRGRTWSTQPAWTLGRYLASAFVNPRPALDPGADSSDPDTALIAKEDARSALLFGPPGTGKTTIVQAMAGAIGWSYVEVQSAAFLSEGMDRVPARADEIFKALMELDRSVILFDEIDELIRLRSDEQTDPFGRFLTTSMLPKLAQLWDQRRVLFFANTNYVAKADPAIRRSQRFDGAVLVMPPAFDKKVEELGSGWTGSLTRDAIQAALDAGRPRARPSNEAVAVGADAAPEVEHGGAAGEDQTLLDPLGVFALLRWDQLAQLRSVDVGDVEGLKQALGELAVELARNEWIDEDPPDNGGQRRDVVEPQEALRQLYKLYWRHASQQRFDESRGRYAAVPRDVRISGLKALRDASVDGLLLARLERPADMLETTGGQLIFARGGTPIMDDQLLLLAAPGT
ncbi:MAG TPA: ATP-binding protein [Solirubrobacteraceae bacterium]|nr:ATP-binding protein [Solirubrobacteraceae bacterium]